MYALQQPASAAAVKDFRTANVLSAMLAKPPALPVRAYVPVSGIASPAFNLRCSVWLSGLLESYCPSCMPVCRLGAGSQDSTSGAPLARPDYGKAPAYLEAVKKQVSAEKDAIAVAVSVTAPVDASTLLPDEERFVLLDAMKVWLHVAAAGF